MTPKQIIILIVTSQHRLYLLLRGVAWSS